MTNLLPISRSRAITRFFAPAATAGRLDPDAFAFFQADARLSGQGFALAVVMNHFCSSGCAFCATAQAIRATDAPISQQSHFRVAQQLNFAHDSIPALVLAAAAAALAQGIPGH